MSSLTFLGTFHGSRQVPGLELGREARAALEAGGVDLPRSWCPCGHAGTRLCCAVLGLLSKGCQSGVNG